jgi:hypothetical protein
MKIQLDTKAKTIKVEEDVKLEELIKLFEKILPKGEWKGFKLLTNVTISHWSNPIYIREYPYTYYPWVTTTSTYGTAQCGGNSNATSGSCTANADVPYTLTSGVYNIEG